MCTNIAEGCPTGKENKSGQSAPSSRGRTWSIPCRYPSNLALFTSYIFRMVDTKSVLTFNLISVCSDRERDGTDTIVSYQLEILIGYAMVGYDRVLPNRNYISRTYIHTAFACNDHCVCAHFYICKE
jgi:hypothetical protein